MPVIVMAATSVAARLLRYTVKDKPGQSEPRVLFAAGVHCRPETAEREFAATRRKHGTQGAARRSPARYELPDAGEIATHVRRTRPGGRRYWALATGEAAATHVRREGAVVRQAEARHVIVSFGRDEVSHRDLEQVASAFQFVLKMQRTLRPGVQAHLVGQADGKGRAFHVHIVENATLYEDMEVEGVVYRAGRKLAGRLTEIDAVRGRADAFLAQHGHEYGLRHQRLPSVAEHKKETRNQRDRRMSALGQLSNHDAIREAFEASMDDPRAVDLASWEDVMSEHGVAVSVSLQQRGDRAGVRRLSYRLEGMPMPVRARTLGQHYEYESALELVEANATGTSRARRPQQVGAGAPRPATSKTVVEVAHMREAVARLARDERGQREEEELDKWITARMFKGGVFDIYDRLPRSYEKRVRVMAHWNGVFAARTDQARSDSGRMAAPLQEKSQRAAAAAEPASERSALAPKSNGPEDRLLDTVIIAEQFVKWDLYKPDLAAMIDAGVEMAAAVEAEDAWNALTREEQRARYLKRRNIDWQASDSARTFADTAGSNDKAAGETDEAAVENRMQLAQAPYGDPPVVRPNAPRPVQADDVARASAVPSADAEPPADAVRAARRRRDAARRRALGDGEHIGGEKDKEFGE